MWTHFLRRKAVTSMCDLYPLRVSVTTFYVKKQSLLCSIFFRYASHPSLQIANNHFVLAKHYKRWMLWKRCHLCEFVGNTSGTVFNVYTGFPDSPRYHIQVTQFVNQLEKKLKSYLYRQLVLRTVIENGALTRPLCVKFWIYGVHTIIADTWR